MGSEEHRKKIFFTSFPKASVKKIPIFRQWLAESTYQPQLVTYRKCFVQLKKKVLLGKYDYAHFFSTFK